MYKRVLKKLKISDFSKNFKKNQKFLSFSKLYTSNTHYKVYLLYSMLYSILYSIHTIQYTIQYTYYTVYVLYSMLYSILYSTYYTVYIL